MDEEEFETFFGRQLRPNVWAQQDRECGRLMVEYYKKNFHGISSGNGNSIPRILHFIWLGPRPLPTIMIESWRQHHVDWEVRVWRDDDIPSNLYNQEAFQYAMQNRQYGMASDILRLELLYRYGGVYMDVDYLCLSCLNDFANLEFYCGASHTGCMEVNNGLFGCRADNFVMRCIMQDIHMWFRQQGRPMSLVSSFLGNSTTSLLTNIDICRHTGPGLWTKVLGRLLVENKMPKTSIIFPHQVFHPMPNTDRHRELTHEQIIHEYSTDKTKAIHLWHSSWQTQDNL
jgi:Glycosyltransferase sugar-binding region containing DXD motif